jgi:hypothetical protein
MRGTKPEWGHLPQTRSSTGKIFAALIATAVGASAGGIVALSFVDRSIDKNGQPGRVASMTNLQHQAQAGDSESANAGQGGGHSGGAAENASIRRSTTSGWGNSALVEQPMATDYGRTKSALEGDETATRAVTLLETNATKMRHVATSGTRSGKWITPGKYYMRVGNTHPHYVHRGWMRTYQNAGWRYDSWD